MHTPDGFITSWVCVLTLIIALGIIVVSAFKVKKTLTREKAVFMAGFAAVIFGF